MFVLERDLDRSGAKLDLFDFLAAQPALDARIGTYTGLYYFASTMAAILGPNVFGLIVQLGGNNYNLLMIFSPVFMVAALFMMFGVRRGEAKAEDSEQ